VKLEPQGLALAQERPQEEGLEQQPGLGPAPGKQGLPEPVQGLA
jgi:hypothetical protein